MPRDAGILADNALLLGYFRQQHTIDRALVDAAYADRLHDLSGQEVPDAAS
jgi:hypothetical protein